MEILDVGVSDDSDMGQVDVGRSFLFYPK